MTVVNRANGLEPVRHATGQSQPERQRRKETEKKKKKRQRDSADE